MEKQWEIAYDCLAHFMKTNLNFSLTPFCVYMQKCFIFRPPALTRHIPMREKWRKEKEIETLINHSSPFLYIHLNCCEILFKSSTLYIFTKWMCFNSLCHRHINQFTFLYFYNKKKKICQSDQKFQGFSKIIFKYFLLISSSFFLNRLLLFICLTLKDMGWYMYVVCVFIDRGHKELRKIVDILPISWFDFFFLFFFLSLLLSILFSPFNSFCLFQ